jgi:hypothetical protein
MTHQKVSSSERKPPRFYVYTANAAIRAEDGTTSFSYPSDSHFAGAVTNDFLLLLRESKTQHNEILLVDKYSGELKKEFQDRPWYFVFYLTEDDSTIYLAANLKPQRSGIPEIASELLLINKQTFELKEIPVGKNIGSLQFKVFSQENLVFIPSFQTIGGYTIPET